MKHKKKKKTLFNRRYSLLRTVFIVAKITVFIIVRIIELFYSRVELRVQYGFLRVFTGYPSARRTCSSIRDVRVINILLSSIIRRMNEKSKTTPDRF